MGLQDSGERNLLSDVHRLRKISIPGLLGCIPRLIFLLGYGKNEIWNVALNLDGSFEVRILADGLSRENVKLSVPAVLLSRDPVTRSKYVPSKIDSMRNVPSRPTSAVAISLLSVSMI